MARIRSIKVDLFMDDGLAEVSLEAHFLLAGLPCIADSAGRLEDRPRRIQAQIFPYRPSVDVDACLSELAATGHVRRYEVGGARYLQVENWAADQRPHVKEAESSIPSPADSTEPRQGSELAGNSPVTRRDKSAGIRDSGCGVLDSGSGISASQEPAVPERPELVLEAKTPKPKARKLVSEKPTDPRHAPLVKALVGLGFPFDGGKDAKNVEGLLALADQQHDTRGEAAPAEVLRRAVLAWGQFTAFPFYSARTLSGLRAKWGDLGEPRTAPVARGAGPPDVRRGSVRAELIDHTKPEEPF